MERSEAKGRSEKSGLFAVYVHWPYCLSKCPYCDFNSHVASSVNHAHWGKAFENEIAYYAAQTPGRNVTSVFFGGGTPSLMEPETTAHVLDTIARRWTLDPKAEITLEANPTSVESGKFRDFKAAGINRVSIGVQALNDHDLKQLGRTHSADEARAAIQTAADTFERYSFDLIYARSGQKVKDWEDELNDALHMAGGHLSLYQLTIEPGTQFETLYKTGRLSIPGNDLAGEMYEVTREMTDKAGLPAYEISNHAAPGQESLHNLSYWRYADYAGIGPGAHGRLTLDGIKYATRGHRAPALWLAQTLQKGNGAHPFEIIAPKDAAMEKIMMGLRIKEGIDLGDVSELAGEPWQSLIGEQALRALISEKLLTRHHNRIAPTSEGLQRLDGLLGLLLG